MLEGSKTNSVLLSGFDYNGKMKDYLNFLTFKEAKAVFMLTICCELDQTFVVDGPPPFVVYVERH